MLDPLITRAGLPADASMAQVVDAVHRIPFGAPADRSAQGTLDEWRGISTTKHELLAAALEKGWPETKPRLVHRVHVCTPEDARVRLGEAAAAAVPEAGVRDVHRYLIVELGGQRVSIDVTYPSTPGWDGAAPMPVAAGEGPDHEAGPDADRELRVLEAAHCDPGSREHLITALSASLASV
ncbi:hypothetical protein [Streptomonospora wellingtoniae]|uniref:Uncharacterized protein n=1 Tax=Streptomonospora wellingtoniae TaxID=3075544 RepID=A0ABU2KX40_9ACTN|nr:hypothetical protein [Streptomonospora sp. DSM 45055]MDT0303810.1 hypothetical protein [Streptomonospora sp. DSM 45055]